MPPILVTGSAGFIGFHLTRALLRDGRRVVGLDNLDDYYDVGLKRARIAALAHDNFVFEERDLRDRAALDRLCAREPFETVLHMAAQPGVRHSLVNPQAYIGSNLDGFANLIEACRQLRVRHLVYASSSSVYGAAATVPFSVHQGVDHPLSLYAATKRANELIAHSYSHLFALPTTGLRFFTVYGPWGRPDMAVFLFTRAILAGEPIALFNGGAMQRDFTYIDDVVEAVLRLIDRPPAPDPDRRGTTDPAVSEAPFRLYNIGNNSAVGIARLIQILEQCLGRKAVTAPAPMQPGDVPATFADVSDLVRDVGFAPRTSLEAGIARFVAWYRGYYGV